MMSVFCSKTLILVPECWKCILRGPDFKIFLGEHAPRPQETCTFGACKSRLWHKFFFLLGLLQSFWHLLKTSLKTPFLVPHLISSTHWFYHAHIRGTQLQFSEIICLEGDLRFRIFWTFVVKFLAWLPLLGFLNI